MHNEKFELIPTDKVCSSGKPLYRIKALKDFGTVLNGDLGGLVSSSASISEEGSAWVFEDAKVCGNARVYGNARVSGNALVAGYALVYGNALVAGDAWVSGYAEVFGDAVVRGHTRLYTGLLTT